MRPLRLTCCVVVVVVALGASVLATPSSSQDPPPVKLAQKQRKAVEKSHAELIAVVHSLMLSLKHEGRGLSRQDRLSTRRKTAKRVLELSRKALAHEDELIASFIQLKIDHTKLYHFILGQADQLKELSKLPPEADQLTGADLETLSQHYLQLAAQVAALAEPYRLRMRSVEQTRGQVLVQLRLLRLNTELLGDQVELLEVMEATKRGELELLKLEKELDQTTALLDNALRTFAKLAKALEVEP